MANRLGRMSTQECAWDQAYNGCRTVGIVDLDEGEVFFQFSLTFPTQGGREWRTVVAGKRPVLSAQEDLSSEGGGLAILGRRKRRQQAKKGLYGQHGAMP